MVFVMPGKAAEMPAAFAEATLLRIADCRIQPGHDEHFIHVQRRVWAPGMAAAGGMLAGCFVQLEQHRYLIATCWSTAAEHQRYTAEDVPRLRARASLTDDVADMVGHALTLEPTWRVVRP